MAKKSWRKNIPTIHIKIWLIILKTEYSVNPYQNLVYNPKDKIFRPSISKFGSKILKTIYIIIWLRNLEVKIFRTPISKFNLEILKTKYPDRPYQNLAKKSWRQNIPTIHTKFALEIMKTKIFQPVIIKVSSEMWPPEG